MRYFLIILFLYCGCVRSRINSGTPVKSIHGHTHILDFGDFQIKTPENWTKMKMQGIDSYVGAITDGKDTLRFDYGRYSNDLKDECEKQLYADDTINGKVGYITKPKIKGHGLLGVYFGDLDGRAFNLATYNSKSENVIIPILQNIRFKTSDTTKNSRTLKFVALENCY